jgi:hypothetical protein
MDRPWNRMSPEVGRKVPVIRLNSVVLPAPFGPMSPLICPGRTRSETSFRAINPPNAFETRRTSRSGCVSRSPVPFQLIRTILRFLLLVGISVPPGRRRAPSDDHEAVGAPRR